MSNSEQGAEPTLELEASGPQLQDFTDSYTLFRETTRKYREAYERLEAQFESLNVKLEDTNRELCRSLEEKDRVSNYLNNILESLTAGVLVVDAQGRITLFNRAAEEITGYSQERVLGRPYDEIIGLESGRENSVLHTLDTGVGTTTKEM